VVVGIAVATVAGATNNDLVTQLLGNTSLLTSLSFSRDQESAADRLAVAALVKRYGHARGATQLFAILKQQHNSLGGKMPEFFATHPLDENRTAAVKVLAQQNGWPLQGDIQAIPSVVRKELQRRHQLRQEKSKKKPKTKAKPGV
jgi:predicted Zn-dependent protease